MRSACFIGTKIQCPSSLWLVNRRYHWQWVSNGGRALRDAKPDVDGHTDRWVSLRSARAAICAAAEDVAITSVDVNVEPRITSVDVHVAPRKRGRPRKDGA